jgi:hypothetical protein
MIRWLRACVLFARLVRFQSPVAWTDDDTAALHALMGSDIARRFMQAMHAHSWGLQDHAVLSAKPFDCGFAAGFRAALAAINSFSAIVPPEEGQTDADAVLGAAALREKYAP